jgi:hypothetical protein
MLARLTATGFGIYLCILGAVFVTGAIGLLAKRLKISAGRRADGRIVGYHQRTQRRRAMKPQYMPLVSFTPRGRDPVEFQSRMSADPTHWPERTLVPVAYRADFPDQAEIATAARLWLAPLVFLLFALACVATAWKVGG